MDKKEKKFKKDFFKFVEKSDSILLTSHMMPDDDSISSVLSMYMIINKGFPKKKIEMIYEGDIDGRWGYFRNFKKIKTVENITVEIEKFDTIVFLDGNQYERFSNHSEDFDKYKEKFVSLDHHVSQSSSYALSYINTKATSVAEIIYDIFIGKEKVEKDLAEILFLGIDGDSGGFRFINKEKASALVKAARLIRDGDIEIQTFQEKRDKFPWKLLGLVKKCVEKATLEENFTYPPFIIAYIPRIKGITDVEYKSASIYFIDSFFRMTAEAKWVAILYPRGDKVKVSLRSKSDDVNVRKITEKMGVGGGHDRASGGVFDKKIKDPAEGVKWVLNWLYKNKFNK